MANNISNVGFSPYSAEEDEIARRRAYAQALQQQGAQPLGPTETIGRWAVQKSPWEGAAKVAQSMSGAYQGQQANELAKALQEKRQGDRSADMTSIAAMLRGAPASSEQIVDEQAEGGMGAPATINAPARAGGIDPAMLAQLRSPEMQGMGTQLWLQQMQRENAPPKWEKSSVRQADGTMKVGYVDVNSRNPEATFRPLGTEPVKQEFVAGQPVNPYTQAGPVQDPNALMIPDGKGGFKPNDALVGIKKDIAAKGAPNVSVKTDVKTGESLAGQVGPMMKDSTATAEGAVKQVDAAQRIVRAVDSSKMLSGPTAEARLTLAQISQTLGIGGKNEAEKIANTRQAMRGLAELTLQGRQQMRGQGAITESEGKLAEKAMSGDISMTAAEIRQLAMASERAARFNYNEHARKLRVMNENPDLRGIAPFYQGPAMPPEAYTPPKPQRRATDGKETTLGAPRVVDW